LQGQYEALSEVLEGRDCTVLLPTGAGKSIIYQMAGLCLPGRTLVIDPINALIDDQMGGLKIHGIDRTIGISSITTKQGLGKALLSAVSNADAYFIFVSLNGVMISAPPIWGLEMSCVITVKIQQASPRHFLP
jgi:ATP-dependent DNA helicase RecQ